VSDSLKVMKKYVSSGEYAIMELQTGSGRARRGAVLRRMSGDPVEDTERIFVPLRDAEDMEFAAAAVRLTARQNAPSAE